MNQKAPAREIFIGAKKMLEKCCSVDGGQKCAFIFYMIMLSMLSRV
jgi:hypothetical protein